MDNTTEEKAGVPQNDNLTANPAPSSGLKTDESLRGKKRKSSHIDNKTDAIFQDTMVGPVPVSPKTEQGMGDSKVGVVEAVQDTKRRNKWKFWKS
jgi:hypothetical protein